MTRVHKTELTRGRKQTISVDLCYIQEVYGAHINRYQTGSHILLASYWTMAGEVPVSTDHAIMNAI
jgi:hypothetical protein